MEFVADNFDVGPLRLQHGLSRGADRFTERIVLIDQVKLLDGRNALHVIGERLHLDVGVRIPAEMPEAALRVGQNRIDGGIVEIQDFLAGALSDFVTKYNERNPGKEVLYFNYAGVDPVLTNAKCSFWH